jgi:hypothetical protein
VEKEKRLFRFRYIAPDGSRWWAVVEAATMAEARSLARVRIGNRKGALVEVQDRGEVKKGKP